MDATEDEVGPMEGKEFGRPSCGPGLGDDKKDLEEAVRCEPVESLRYGVEATRRSSSVFAVLCDRKGLSSSRSFLILTLPPKGSAGLSMSRLFLLDPDCISTSSSAIPEDDLREWSFFFSGITLSSRSPVQDGLGAIAVAVAVVVVVVVVVVAVIIVDLDGLDGEGAKGCGTEMEGMDIDLEMVGLLSSVFSFGFDFVGRSDSSLSLCRLVLRSLVLGRL